MRKRRFEDFLVEGPTITIQELSNRTDAITLDEYRILYWSVAKIPNSYESSLNKPLPVFRITCKEFAALTRSSKTGESLYKELKETVDKMQTVKVAWWDEEHQRNIVAVLVPTITYKDGEDALEFEFNKSLNVHLLNLKNQLSKLQITEAMQLTNGSI